MVCRSAWTATSEFHVAREGAYPPCRCLVLHAIRKITNQSCAHRFAFEELLSINRQGIVLVNHPSGVMWVDFTGSVGHGAAECATKGVTHTKKQLICFLHFQFL